MANKDYGKPPKNGFAAMVCELYVENIDVSLNFWCDVLGFSIAYQRPEESFAYLERQDGAQVMLYQSPVAGIDSSAAQSQPTVLLQIFVESLSPVVSAVEKNSWPLQSGPQDVWRRWGDRMGGKKEIRLLDPDGHMVLVAEDIGEKPI